MGIVPGTPQPDNKPKKSRIAGPPIVARTQHRRPHRAFAVAARGEILEHHEGYGLSVDAVVRSVVGMFRDSDGSGAPEDLCIFEGPLCVAIVHHLGDGRGTCSVTRIEHASAFVGAVYVD